MSTRADQSSASVDHPLAAARGQVGTVSLVMMVASGTIVLPWSTTVLGLVLPSIMEDFAADVSSASWLMTIYLIANAALITIGGRLGDMYGHQRIFNIGLVCVGFASLICAISPNLGILIFGRFLQGAAGAAVLPNGYAMIRYHAPANQRGRAFGIVTACNAASASAAPAIGGIFVELFNWQSVFLLNVAFVIISLILASRFIGKLATSKGEKRSFDHLGSIFLALFSGFLSLAISVRSGGGIAPWWRVGLFAFSGACFVLLLVQERRTTFPLIQFSLFRIRNFSASTLCGIFLNLTMYGLLLITPLILQQVLGYEPTRAGVVMLMLTGSVALTAPVSGALSDRFGRRLLPLVGLLVIVAATLSLARITPSSGLLFVLVGFFGAGLGIGIVIPIVQTAALEAAPSNVAGVASGVYFTARFIGGAVGSSIISGATFGLTPGAAMMPAFRSALLWFGLFSIVAFVIACAIKPRFDPQVWQAAQRKSAS